MVRCHMVEERNCGRPSNDRVTSKDQGWTWAQFMSKISLLYIAVSLLYL